MMSTTGKRRYKNTRSEEQFRLLQHANRSFFSCSSARNELVDVLKADVPDLFLRSSDAGRILERYHQVNDIQAVKSQVGENMRLRDKTFLFTS
jgi:hypothetical protein